MPTHPASRTPGADSVLPASRHSPLAVAGLLVAAIVLSSLANAVIAVIALAAGASDEFQPLQASAYVPLTVIGVLAGAAGWALLGRRPSARSLLNILVPTIVALSFIPDLAMLAGDYQPNADGA